MSTSTHLLHLHNFLFKTSISIINWNTYNANQEFIWCLPVAFYIFFPLICTFFWTLCAIWVAPIKISSSFIGLIRSATCKFEKNCHVIKNTPYMDNSYIPVPMMLIRCNSIYSLIVCLNFFWKFNKSELPFPVCEIFIIVAYINPHEIKKNQLTLFFPLNPVFPIFENPLSR